MPEVTDSLTLEGDGRTLLINLWDDGSLSVLTKTPLGRTSAKFGVEDQVDRARILTQLRDFTFKHVGAPAGMTAPEAPEPQTQ